MNRASERSRDGDPSFEELGYLGSESLIEVELKFVSQIIKGLIVISYPEDHWACHFMR